MDATRFAEGPAVAASADAGALFHDQVSISDVVIGSKADLCDSDTLKHFTSWAGDLFPPKALVATAEHGQLDHSWLFGMQRSAGEVSATPSGRGSGSFDGTPGLSQLAVPGRPGAGSGRTWLTNAAEAEAQPAPRLPQRKVSEAGSSITCGWAFATADMFQRARLVAWLSAVTAAPSLLRLKGVFRMGPKSWAAVNWVPMGSSCSSTTEQQPVQLQDIAYRGGSRVELIMGSLGVVCSGAQESVAAGALQKGDWAALEASLLRALQSADG